MKNLVMGLVKGYRYEQIRPFVASLRNAGYSGEICLFYSDLDERTLRLLRDHEVDLVPFTSATLYSILQRVHLGSSFYKLYYRLRHSFSPGQTEKKQLVRFRIAAKIFNVYCVRYPLYYLYLAQHPGKYAKVMLSDVRDVLFQRDPFDFEFDDSLCFFMEDDRQPMKKCPYNSMWLKSGYGQEVLQELGEEIASCSGITIGSTAAVMNYLELMVDQMLRLKSQPDGMDQGVHNYLLYKHEIKNVRLFPNRLGPVFTMGKTVDLPTQFDAEGFVLNKDGTVAHVLHQYDRHVELGKLKFDEARLRVRHSTTDRAQSNRLNAG